MLYDPRVTISVEEIRDFSLENAAALSGAGLWILLVSRGICRFAGSPPQQAGPGGLALWSGEARLPASADCHVLAIRLTGTAAEDFLSGLPAGVLIAHGESCPGAAEQMQQLADCHGSGMQSQLAFALLCELSGADTAAPVLPELVAAAAEDIRRNYAGLYGVEELSEKLGVSKSHLVRAFHAAMGISPGKYLTGVRIAAAKQLLLHREYSLDIIASLCGFSGANYLCRVFRRETGVSPAAWRTGALAAAAGGQRPASLREKELYV